MVPCAVRSVARAVICALAMSIRAALMVCSSASTQVTSTSPDPVGATRGPSSTCGDVVGIESVLRTTPPRSITRHTTAAGSRYASTNISVTRSNVTAGRRPVFGGSSTATRLSATTSAAFVVVRLMPAHATSASSPAATRS
jgi:hypothetical protein